MTTTDQLATERWAPIPGYEQTYEVSTRGRVNSRPRPTTRGGILTWSPDNYGYPRVTLVQGGKQRKVRVHLLVMAAFVGPTPEGMEVRHLDGDSSNPRLDNLAFGTHAENMADMVRHGRSTRRTTCQQGHPRVEGNLSAPGKNGGRHCLTCAREAWAAKKRGV